MPGACGRALSAAGNLIKNRVTQMCETAEDCLIIKVEAFMTNLTAHHCIV